MTVNQKVDTIGNREIISMLSVIDNIGYTEVITYVDFTTNKIYSKVPAIAVCNEIDNPMPLGNLHEFFAKI